MIGFNAPSYLNIQLTSSEQRLLLHDRVRIHNHLRGKIKQSQTQRRQGKVFLSILELEQLLDTLAREARRSSAPKLKQDLMNLHFRLAAVYELHLGQSAPATPENIIMQDWKAEISTLLEDESFNSLDEINHALKNLSDKRNRRPDPAMGGLSPSQVARLIHCKWDQPHCPIQFDDNLSLEDLADAGIFQNVRTMMSVLVSAGGTPATTKGNLNRKFVLQMFEAMNLPDTVRAAILRYHKVFNEEDVWDVHLSRIVAQQAGLIHKTKGKFTVPRKILPLLTAEKAGQMFRQLFIGFFQRFNLAYMDGYDELEGLQITVAYTLYHLHKLAGPWRSPQWLFTRVLLPAVQEELTQCRRKYMETAWPMNNRILKPLAGFGLLELQYEPRKFGLNELVNVRKTPLFDRFLRFTVEVGNKN